MTELVTARLVLRLPQIDYFKAADPIEKVPTLNVRNYGAGTAHQLPDCVRLADVLLPGCKTGDLVKATGGYQVTTELPYLVEVSGSLVLSREATGVTGWASMIGTGGRGYNADAQMHHAPLEMHGAVVVPDDGDWWVVMMAYAGGGSTSQPGDTVRVDVGYGDLDVIRYRNIGIR